MTAHPALVCVVCAGQHHPDDCDRARRFVAECRMPRRQLIRHLRSVNRGT